MALRWWMQNRDDHQWRLHLLIKRQWWNPFPWHEFHTSDGTSSCLLRTNPRNILFLLKLGVAQHGHGHISGSLHDWCRLHPLGDNEDPNNASPALCDQWMRTPSQNLFRASSLNSVVFQVSGWHEEFECWIIFYLSMSLPCILKSELHSIIMTQYTSYS